MAGADCRINLRPCSRLRVDRKVFALVAIRVTLVASRQLSCGRSRVGRRRVPVDSDCVDCLWRGAGGEERFKSRTGIGGVEGGGGVSGGVGVPLDSAPPARPRRCRRVAALTSSGACPPRLSAQVPFYCIEQPHPRQQSPPIRAGALPVWVGVRSPCRCESSPPGVLPV